MDRNLVQQSDFESITTNHAGKQQLRHYEFDNSEFDFKIELNGEIRYISFTNCKFLKKVILKNVVVEQNVTFKDTIFEDDAIFSDSEFKKKVRFHKTQFKKEADFDNTKFNDLADFYESIFESLMVFYKTDFLGTVVFSDTHFMQNVLFTFTLFDSVAIFQGTNFHKGVDLSLSIPKGEFNFFGFDLKDFEVSNRKLLHAQYEYAISVSGIIPIENKRETFRLIKYQLQKHGNRIDSLKYQTIEIAAYRHELHRKIFKDREIKQNLGNYTILLLNSISNANGRSWVLGIIFTFCIALIFFYSTLLSITNYSFSFYFNPCFVKLFFEFLSPIHRSGIFDEANLITKSSTYFWDFIGRIAISFGIYQTVQAFRKFKSV